MKVFISWSGEQSRQIAGALRDWLPMVIQAVEPYMSERDNHAGVRWNDEVSTQLESTDFGILCLTPDNLTAPWLHFEAGALGKAIERGRVVPLLFRLRPTDVKGPLSQFMMKPADETGVKDISVAINGVLDRPMSDQALTGVFRALWGQLKQQLDRIEEEHATLSEVDPPQRSERDLLEEILQIVRDQRGGGGGFRNPLTSFYDDSAEIRGIIALLEREMKRQGHLLSRDGHRIIVNLAQDSDLQNEDGLPGTLMRDLADAGLDVVVHAPPKMSTK
ncbi:toll/interleukin-1 receptor domain-containing protein [Geodermatophilus sp. SYSU D00758]